MSLTAAEGGLKSDRDRLATVGRVEWSVVIDPRFHGPPASANGGYACGVVAEGVDGVATVTLRLPPPLGRPLLLHSDGGTARLLDGEAMVGEAQPATLDLEVPSPPTLEEAEEGMRHYAGWHRHPFDTCFVCGPRREPGDGLRIFPGPVPGRSLAASLWRPDASLSDDRGEMSRRFVWSALDCPSYFGLGTSRVALLGRLTAEISRVPATGETLIAMGWPLQSEGRKMFSGSAVVSGDGEVLARAAAVWIELRQRTDGEPGHGS